MPRAHKPAPRCVAAYVLGYTMWGTTGRVARQYGVLSARIWHDRRVMRWWQDGHNDAADGLPRRFTASAPRVAHGAGSGSPVGAGAVRPRVPAHQLALLEVPHAQP